MTTAPAPVPISGKSAYCRNCGKELAANSELCMNCGARPMAGTSFCLACGSPTNPLAEICIKCGVRFPAPVTAEPIKPPIAQTWRPTVAGILNIIAGVVGLISGVLLMVSPRFIIDLYGLGNMYGSTAADRALLQAILNGFVIGGIIVLIMGIITIIGGVFSTKRKKWGLGLTASIMAILMTLVLGILSTIFISQGKKEFT